MKKAVECNHVIKPKGQTVEEFYRWMKDQQKK